jgi:hypothetical protein
MKARITNVSGLNERKQITLIFDIVAGKNNNMVAPNQSVTGQPSELEERIKDMLSAYEAEANLASQFQVGQIIKSNTED